MREDGVSGESRKKRATTSKTGKNWGHLPGGGERKLLLYNTLKGYFKGGGASLDKEGKGGW